MPITPFTGTVKAGPCAFAKQIKLLNRRVMVKRDFDGGTGVYYKALRGWKDISIVKVGLSPEAVEATIMLLLQSQTDSIRHEAGPLGR